jgi:formamidopyrimidine-DNA glycosylase
MVEGPGCKLKGEKMRGKVVGQTVVHVSGNAVDKRPKKAGDSPLLALVGQQVVDVRTLGKELFILLSGGSCLRVHFLMAGFVRYNDLAGKTAQRSIPVLCWDCFRSADLRKGIWFIYGRIPLFKT